MPADPLPTRVAVVVHPTRSITEPLELLERWCEANGTDLVQLVVGNPEPQVAARGEVGPGDLVVALGGDGTVLAALRAAATVGAPVLGVACGSLGALAAIPSDRLLDALERFRAGDWTARQLPALAVQPLDGAAAWAVNDFVVVRHGGSQVVIHLSVDDELYARFAGDGLIVATPLGSSAYSMAAGGPILAPGSQAIVCTPLAMHGGNAPPIVVPATSTVRVEVHPSYTGFVAEIDGRIHAMEALDYRLSLHHEKLTLVSFGELGLGLSVLRKRGLVTDSPRVLARDRRPARDAPQST